MKPNLFTQTALFAARAGGDVLVRRFTTGVKVGYKGLINPVTEADRSSQELIFRILKKNFPGHSILGEEGKGPASLGEYSWIVDPLDGTVNYIHNLPIFSVSIGLLHNGEVVSGVVHAPLLNETFIAQKGAGAWLNGKRIAVSPTSRLIRSLAVTGFSYDVYSRPGAVMRRLVRVSSRVQGIRRLGSAALDLAYVALGRFEAFWEQGLSPWDVAAGSLIVREAGGRISDFSGGKDFIFGRSIVATNGRIHREMLKLIRGGRAVA